MKLRKYIIRFRSRDTKGKLHAIEHTETVFDYEEGTAIQRAFMQLPNDILRLPVVSAEAFEDRT